jgi:3-deoxy-manno-octulosonate cytidylyltransferase (CMP-KDO synthetase)
MKILGVIPSRYGSSRFPGKPLVDLAGKSMIQRVYEGASQCSVLHKVIVATDDSRIFEHVESFGGNVIMTSDEHLSGTDRCGEVLSKFPEYDVIVNIQGETAH